MEFELITSLSDNLWEKVRKYAAACSWPAGKSLAHDMEADVFTNWERVIIAHQGEQICGYCTVAEADLSQKLIQFAISYLKGIGFNDVYLVSDHENLYEKYGFCIVDRTIAPWGSIEKIYHKTI